MSSHHSEETPTFTTNRYVRNLILGLIYVLSIGGFAYLLIGNQTHNMDYANAEMREKCGFSKYGSWGEMAENACMLNGDGTCTSACEKESCGEEKECSGNCEGEKTCKEGEGAEKTCKNGCGNAECKGDCESKKECNGKCEAKTEKGEKVKTEVKAEIKTAAKDAKAEMHKK